MAFDKTYKEFCDEMQAVKVVSFLIEDDFLLDLLLKTAYEHTLKKVSSYLYEEAIQIEWNALKAFQYFDRHFTWRETKIGVKDSHQTWRWLKDACVAITEENREEFMRKFYIEIEKKVE